MKKTIALGMLISTLALAGCQSSQVAGGDTETQTTPTSTTSTNTTSNMQTQSPSEGDTIVTLKTDKGDIKIKLFTKEAPETTKNFVELSKTGKYDGVPFHRVIEGFMIQTGDFTAQNGTGGHSYKGPGTTIADEFSRDLKHLKGTVSMANSGANTNGSQFFIVTAEQGTPHLNNKHSVFGQVYEGLNIAEEISRVSTGAQDVPLSPIQIKSVEVGEY